MGDRVPDHVIPVQLDSILKNDVPTRRDRRAGHPRLQSLGPAVDRAEVTFDEAAASVEIDVADQRQAGVGGHIVASEEGRDILEGRRIEVLHDPDRQPAIGMLGRIECLRQDRPDHAVGAIRIVLAVFVLHDALLNS